MNDFILTYHSHHVVGPDYSRNDHVALAVDLESIIDANFTIAPLDDLVQELAAGYPPRRACTARKRRVAITFDDGPVYDVEDFLHPEFGYQKSFLAILQEFASLHGLEPRNGLHATSFVIASPEARQVMERTYDKDYTYLGPGSMTDEWWNAAIATRLISIANHSWDHLHPALPKVAHSRQARADFTQVLTDADAEAQIAGASAYIAERTNKQNSPYFAYPFGQHNAFLAEDYLPRNAKRLGLRAAFTAGAMAITGGENEWRLPRFVCGHHWESPEGLMGILSGSPL